MGTTYNDWLKEIDRLLDAEWGIGHNDLPPCNWFEMWLARMPAGKAVGMALGELLDGLIKEATP